MHIIIKEKNKLNHFDLNNNFVYKGINIYKNDRYYISLNNDLFFSDGEKIKTLENKKYIINNDKKFYSMELYVYEEYDKSYSLYKTENFLLAKDQRANIIIEDKYLKNYYLYFKNGHIETNYRGLLLNGKSYNNEKLQDSDHIEMLSFSFYYNKEFLYISNNQVLNKLSKFDCKPKIIKYKNNFKQLKNSILEIEIKELELQKLEVFKGYKHKERKIYSQVTSSLVMSLILLTISLNNMKNNNSIIYILMPIGMFISGVILPIIFYSIDINATKKENKKIKDDYLEYLKDELEQRKSIILKHEELYDKQIFRFNNHKPIYSITNKSLYYLDINLGFKEKLLDFEYKYTNDKEIDIKIDEIRSVSKISNYPVNLNLKNNKYVTIISSKANKEYVFHKVLLSFLSLHNFEDVNVAVFYKSDKLDSFLYNIPHLFIDNQRLTIKNQKELIELDQNKYDKPVILFLFDKTNYICTNKNIITIYFSDNKDDVLKNSDSVVIFEHSKGRLLAKQEEEFTYFLEDVDYKKEYSYLGLFNKSAEPKTLYSFKNIYLPEEIETLYTKKQKNLVASFAYSDNEIYTLDIHENSSGPHGLVGGSTGSGKTELLISFLLSLAITYSPTYLNMIIIDYKGREIVDSLSYEGNNIPHIVASLTNLEKNNFNRLLLRIKKEIEEREKLFKELSFLSKSPVSNIDTYLDKCETYSLKKMSHLLILVDEFAELKKEHPDYIKELISISRIGRSIGIHLILATQKPGGNIDEQIFSNSHFKIALKTLEENDSLEIIKSKDAAYLKDRGEFIILVDDSIKKCKAIFSKRDYFNNEPYTVKLLDNTLQEKSSICKRFIQNVFESSIYVKQIIDVSNKLKLSVNSIDYEERKAITSIDNMPRKFLLGEIDDYYNQVFEKIYIDIKENILIYSNRENEINYFLNTLDTNKRNTIVISNNVFSNNHISDCLKYDEQEDIAFLFSYILNNKIDNTTLIIEDINMLLSYRDTYVDELIKILKRKNDEDFNIILFSSNSAIPYKLLNQFNYRFAININNDNDVINVFNKTSKYIGDSYYFNKSPITYVPLKLDSLIGKERLVPKLVKKIPNIINAAIKNNMCLLGYEINSREEVYLSKDYPLLICSFNSKLLDNYKQYNFQITNMNDLDKKRSDSILWLGSGLFKQNIFMPLINRDLSDDEAYLLIEGKYRIVKVINNV